MIPVCLPPAQARRTRAATEVLFLRRLENPPLLGYVPRSGSGVAAMPLAISTSPRLACADRTVVPRAACALAGVSRCSTTRKAIEIRSTISSVRSHSDRGRPALAAGRPALLRRAGPTAAVEAEPGDDLERNAFGRPPGPVSHPSEARHLDGRPRLALSRASDKPAPKRRAVRLERVQRSAEAPHRIPIL